ncbi:EthD domain-containing protein [Salinactinospora qingdaonensis]|uniref:EthD domain-containing protein n=1 Tax=Salinactinospora qingdaonensis TaxID=702744 RepID=A0ABP7FIQ0_9ACTN
MIHQFIFAAPKPGMSVEEFQDYWLNVHAVRYAAKIPQIRRYLIDTRIPFEADLGVPALPHQGIAEIWLDNEEEQLASLQTEEFLQGARADEPNWAAFWQTIVIDTTEHPVGPGLPHDPAAAGVKMTTLLKRMPGTALSDYRERTLGSYAAAVATLPGLTGYLHCHTRDGGYIFGEAAFDSVEQMWFADRAALRQALASPAYEQQVRPERDRMADPNYVFSMTCHEHWVVGPQPREEAMAAR